MPKSARDVRVVGLLLLSAVLAGACGSSNSEPTAASGSALRVVTTTAVLSDFAAVIGRDLVDVHGLARPGVDPHDFEPSPADLDAIARAGVIVRNGLGLEAWFDDVVEAAEPSGLVVDASKGVEPREASGGGHAHDDHNGEHADEHTGGGEVEVDPHIWQSPVNAKVMIENMVDAFVDMDNENADTYRRNADAYLEQLDALDVEIATQIDALDNKLLVTNHDAFGYYVDRYDLTFVGSVIPSFDTSAELSAGELADLVDKINDLGVKAVFSESSLPPKTARAIADEADVEVVAGDDALYGDSLGPPGSDADDYLAMMRHNTRTIVTHLS